MRRKMYLFTIFHIFLLIAVRGFAQDSVHYTLRGQVLDGNGYPVEFATVSLTDTLQRAGAITAADGALACRLPRANIPFRFGA